MRDLANKMAELKFEAPLAKFEETDDWGPIDFQSATINNSTTTTTTTTVPNAAATNASLKAAISDALNLNIKEGNDNNRYLLEEAIKDNCLLSSKNENNLTKNNTQLNNLIKDSGNIDNFAEAFTGSLEDLVNTFDEKITKCFGNYEQSVEDLAPVQVRTQEEIMNECQLVYLYVYICISC